VRPAVCPTDLPFEGFKIQGPAVLVQTGCQYGQIPNAYPDRGTAKSRRIFLPLSMPTAEIILNINHIDARLAISNSIVIVTVTMTIGRQPAKTGEYLQ
jgi:hypothetical protein